MKKIKIAQIGTSKNSHGNAVWNSMLKQSDIFDVVGYAFPENEREKFPDHAKSFDRYREMSVEEILNDPQIEAVAVETEEIYLTKYARMVADAGKHLHMEKPGGIDFSEFTKLIDILKDKKMVFSTGYMYRFNPRIREAIAKVKSGELGQIYAVEAHMSIKHSTEVRKWLNAFPGGMLFYLGCHLIDLVYQLQGEPMEVLPLSCSTGIDGISSPDYGMAVFRYPNGLSYVKTSANERGGFMRRQLVICGEKGTIEIKPLEVLLPNGQYTVSAEAYSEDWFQAWTVSQTEVYDRYDGMMRNFAEMIRGKSNPYSYDYELSLYRLILRSCGKEIAL